MGKRILGRNRLETVECHSGEADCQDPQEQYRDGEGETIGSAHANHHGIETLRIIGDHHTQWTGYCRRFTIALVAAVRMRTDETATAEVEIDRASVLRAIRMDHADVQNVGVLLDDIVELFVTFRQLEPIHTRQVVEKARLSGTLSDGEYEEFLRWLSSTDLVEEADQSGHYRLGNAVSSTRSPDAHSEE